MGSIVNFCNVTILIPAALRACCDVHIMLGGAFPKRYCVDCDGSAIIYKVSILGRHTGAEPNGLTMMHRNMGWNFFLLYLPSLRGPCIRMGWVRCIRVARGPFFLALRLLSSEQACPHTPARAKPSSARPTTTISTLVRGIPGLDRSKKKKRKITASQAGNEQSQHFDNELSRGDWGLEETSAAPPTCDWIRGSLIAAAGHCQHQAAHRIVASRSSRLRCCSSSNRFRRSVAVW
jgi:hypothetical protein